MTTLAGYPSCSGGYYCCGDNAPATSSNVGEITGLSFAPDGSLLVSVNTSDINRVLRIDSPLPKFTDGTFVIPSADASEVYTFDVTGRHLQTLDALTGGSKYTFGYESLGGGALGRLTSITYAPGTSYVTTIAYDDANATGTVTSPFGDVTSFALDAYGNMSTVSRQGGPASAPRTETYTLAATPSGLLTSFSDPNNTAASQVHTMTYDTSSAMPTGRLTSDSDPAGGQQMLSLSLSYGPGGPDGVVTRSTLGDNAQSYSNVYETAYDAAGNEDRANTFATATNKATTVIGTNGSRTYTAPDGTVVATSLAPDPRYGLLAPTTSTTTTLPLNGLQRVEAVARFLDSQGQLHETDTINGNTWTKVYNPATMTTTSTTPVGRTSTMQLDSFGRVVSQAMAGFGSTSFAYTSNFSQLATVTRSASGETSRVARNTYYPVGSGLGVAGNLASAVDPASNVTTFDAYDLAGRLLHQTLPGARPIGLGYDANGNTIEVAPPPATPSYGSSTLLQAQHLFGFTSLNQLASYQVHDASAAPGSFLETTGYVYTPDRLLKTLLRPEGDMVSYATALGRVSGYTAPGGESLQNTYDSATGQLTSVAGPAGVTLSFGYNGSLVTDLSWSGVGSSAMTLHRDYDNNLRVIDETAQGIELFYGYDADGLMSCVGTASSTNCAGQLSINRVSGSALLAGTTFPTGGSTQITDSYTSNGFGETLSYTAMAGGQTAYTVTYTRDALGRIATKSETLLNADASTSAASYAYSYDAAGRLTDVTAGDGTHTHYDYDANGNRLRRSVEGPGGNSEELGTYGVADQLTSYNGTTYTYTASGQLASATSAAGTTTYVYDAFGNLIAVALPNGTAIAYLVDGQHRRIGKQVNGALTTAWLYEDELRVAAEVDFDATGNVTQTKRFGYGSKQNVPDLMVMGDGTRYRLVSDHLGSVRMVLAENRSTTVARVDYDDYGRVLGSVGAVTVPVGFAGGLWDADAGLVRFGARDYDPTTGRWTAKDPSGFAGDDTNLYAYVGEEPINRADASGNTTINCWGKTSAGCAVECVAAGMACLPLSEHPLYAGMWGGLSACSNTGGGPVYTCAYTFPGGQVCVRAKVGGFTVHTFCTPPAANDCP